MKQPDPHLIRELCRYRLDGRFQPLNMLSLGKFGDLFLNPKTEPFKLTMELTKELLMKPQETFGVSSH